MNLDFDRVQAGQLNQLERQLAEAVEAREAAESRYNLLFAQVFHLFDDAVGENAPTKFICDDGFKLARLVPQMQPRIDEEKIRKIVESFGSDNIGARMWKRITDVKRVINQDKLAKEIKRYPALGELIDSFEAVKVPERKPSRIRTEATRDEMDLLRISQKNDQEAAV